MNAPADGHDAAGTPPEAPSHQADPVIPAGWYDDPSSSSTQRYWDGSQWTSHTAPRPAAQPIAPRKSSKATASLVLGILGILFLPVIFSLLAIIFAVQARSEIDKDPTIENRGRATAGLWLGIAGLAIWALIIIAVSGP